MTNYTKGKWSNNGGQIESEYFIICTVGQVNNQTQDNTANANLIAASPTMFEFIESLADNGNQEAKAFIRTLALSQTL